MAALGEGLTGGSKGGGAGEWTRGALARPAAAETGGGAAWSSGSPGETGLGLPVAMASLASPAARQRGERLGMPSRGLGTPKNAEKKGRGGRDGRWP